MRTIWFFLLITASLIPFMAHASENLILTIQGIDGQNMAFSMDDISRLPQQTVTANSDGRLNTYEGVLLSDALNLVTVPVGGQFKKTAAGFYVLAEGVDGYRSVFSWGEIDPAFTDKPVNLYLVTKLNGEPLWKKTGPIWLVAPSDSINCRWVKKLKQLTIRKAD